MSTQDNNINQPLRGLHLDTSPQLQPEGTYRFALNGVRWTELGDEGYIATEQSFDPCGTLPAGSNVIGHIYTEDDDVVLFLITTESFEIGILDGSCTYTTFIKSDCLSFDINHAIQGVYRIRNGCERTIYFTDNINPPRTINLDKLENYLLDGETITTANADGEGWDCDLFKLFFNCTFPCITLDEVSNTGGALNAGVYQFAVRYLDGNQAPTQWLYVTNPVPVTDDNYNSYLAAVDGAPTGTQTTKRIILRFSDLDSSFEYIQVAAIPSIAGNQFTGAVEALQPVQYGNNTEVTVIYRGNETDSFLTDLDEVTIPPLSPDTAKTIEQLENRLILGNIKDKVVNLAELQQAANDITCKYVVREAITAEDSDSNVDSRDPNYWFEERSFMRDEVYAFGIVFVFEDGTYSPAFHIPGREKNLTTAGVTISDLTDPNTHNRPAPTPGQGWDSTTIAAGPDTAHLGAGTKERWEVYNTALQDAVPISGDYVSSGELAYYESELDYPDIEDCNGTRIYPTGKIRFHKMPDTQLERHYTGAGYNFAGVSPGDPHKTYRLGVLFDDVTYPDSRIQGHYFVRVKRDEFNSTVLDKGIITHAADNSVNTVSNRWSIGPWWDNLFGTDNAQIMTFNSPKMFFNEDSFSSGTHVKAETVLTSAVTVSGTNIFTEASYQDWPDTVTTALDTTFTNRPITATVLTSPAKSVLNTTGVASLLTTISNICKNRSELFVALGSTGIPTLLSPNSGARPYTSGTAQTYYGSIKNSNRPFGTLTSLTYYAMHNCMFVEPRDSPYPVFGGDVFISRLAFKSQTNSRGYLDYFWVESEINCDFRDTGDDETNTCYVHFPYSFTNPITTAQQDYIDLENSGADFLPGTSSPPGSISSTWDVCPDFFSYNADYSKVMSELPFFPIPAGFDFCSDCNGHHPNRIIYSEQSFQEGAQDKYRNFLSENFADIDAKGGDITNIWSRNDQLFVHTEESLWQVPRNIQQQTSGEFTVQLGTGAFFAIPPREVSESTIGFSGSQSQWATFTNNSGAFYVDQRDGKVFIFGQQINEISNRGLSRWLDTNLPSKWKEQVRKLAGYNPALPDNPANPTNGQGLIVGWDNQYDRYLLTKKDYILRPEVLDDIIVVNSPDDILLNKIFWQIGTDTVAEGWYVGIEDGVAGRLIDFDEEDYYQNVSWTLSYSVSGAMWVSWHSYIPNWYVTSKNYLYSFIGATIFRHNGVNLTNKPDYLSYYSAIPNDHILELVSNKNPLITKQFVDFKLQTEAKKYDPDKNQYIDDRLVTFNKVIFYNTRQCSGEWTLVPKDENTLSDPNYLFDAITNNSQSMIIDRNERDWTFNHIRDYVVDTSLPMFSSEWVDTQSDYFIDKVLNSSAIDYNKTWDEVEIMRDKYLIARLIFVNLPTNTLLITNYLIDKHNQSIR